MRWYEYNGKVVQAASYKEAVQIVKEIIDVKKGKEKHDKK